MADEPRQVKPVVPKTTMPHARHKKLVRPDAHFVTGVIGKVDKEANQLRAAAWWSWKRGPFEFCETGEEEEATMSTNKEANSALRKMSGRVVPPAQGVDPRQAQLEGLAKACGCKAVPTVVSMVPDHIKTDIQVIEWLDSFAQAVPHCFDTDLTDRTVQQVIASASQG